MLTAIGIGSLFLQHTVLAASSNVEVTVCYPTLTAPAILQPDDGLTTEESSVIGEGTTDPGTTVYLFRNAAQIGYVTSGPDGAYALSASLLVGDNTLHTSVRNECNVLLDSPSVMVHRQALPETNNTIEQGTSSPDSKTTVTSVPGVSLQAPEEGLAPAAAPQTGAVPKGIPPRILQPLPNAHVTQSALVVKGVAAPNTAVRIFLNSRVVAEVTTTDQGLFVVTVYLAEGENHINALTGSGPEEIVTPELTVFLDKAAGNKSISGLKLGSLIVGIPLAAAALGLLIWRFSRLGILVGIVKIFKRKG